MYFTFHSRELSIQVDSNVLGCKLPFCKVLSYCGGGVKKESVQPLECMIVTQCFLHSKLFSLLFTPFFESLGKRKRVWSTTQCRKWSNCGHWWGCCSSSSSVEPQQRSECIKSRSLLQNQGNLSLNRFTSQTQEIIWNQPMHPRQALYTFATPMQKYQKKGTHVIFFFPIFSWL